METPEGIVNTVVEFCQPQMTIEELALLTEKMWRKLWQDCTTTEPLPAPDVLVGPERKDAND